MRCYNCQRYGHHTSQCQQGHKSVVCSGRNETSVCINKHKNGQETKAKCPNYHHEHHTWYRRCPSRLEKIHKTAPAPLATRTLQPAPKAAAPKPAAAPRTAPQIMIDYVKPKSAPQALQPATYKKPIYIEMDDLHLALQKFATNVYKHNGKNFDIVPFARELERDLVAGATNLRNSRSPACTSPSPSPSPVPTTPALSL